MAEPVLEILPGLWRWTTPHPDWNPEQGGPEGWARDVASLAYAGDGAFVLIDALVLGEARWEELDGLVAAHGGPVSVVVTCKWHERSGAEALARYVNSPGCTVHAHAKTANRMDWDAGDGFQGDAKLPGGVEAIETDPNVGEVTLWLERLGAVVAADVLIGAEGERTEALRACPDEWLEETTPEAVRAALKRFTELPVAAVVPLHGAPVLDGAHEALAAALSQRSGIHNPD